MKNKKFSREDALKYGWQKTKENIGFFIVLLIIYGAVLIVPSFLAGQITKHIDSFLGFLIRIADFIIRIIISIGFLKIFLKFIDKRPPRYSDLFTHYKLFFNYLGGNILYFLIVFAGTLLLVIPGFIFAVKYYFYTYTIVDKGLGPSEALKRSADLTAGAKWDIFFFLVILAGINLLGALALLAGLFFTIPLSSLAMVYVYRELENNRRRENIIDTPPDARPDSGEILPPA